MDTLGQPASEKDCWEFTKKGFCEQSPKERTLTKIKKQARDPDYYKARDSIFLSEVYERVVRPLELKIAEIEDKGGYFRPG